MQGSSVTTLTCSTIVTIYAVPGHIAAVVLFLNLEKKVQSYCCARIMNAFSVLSDTNITILISILGNSLCV
jgi:hypothetical protein